MSSSKQLESWLVFFNPSELDSLSDQMFIDELKGNKSFFGLAVDGGIKRANQLELPVNWHIGDFDSSVNSCDSYQQNLKWCGINKLATSTPQSNEFQVIKFSREKDFLDGEAVFEILRSRNLDQVIFFDFWQGRWDFSLFHFMCLRFNDWLANHLRIVLPNGSCYYAEGTRTFTASKGTSFSILPLEIMENIKLRGSKYDGDFNQFSPQKGHSLSNIFASDSVQISVGNKTRYLFFVFNNLGVHA